MGIGWGLVGDGLIDYGESGTNVTIIRNRT